MSKPAEVTETTEEKAPRIAAKGRRTGPLPEAGDARREELKKRFDDLMELKAAMEAELQENGVLDIGEGKNLADLRVENEIAQHFDLLQVPGALDEMAYCWVNFASQHGIHVTAKQAWGWEIVRGDMPECPERRDELGRRRIGDVILMRIKLDQYVRLGKQERAKRRLQQEGIESALQELGDRKGVRVTTGLERMDPRMLDVLMRRMQAKSIASSRFDRQLRDGNVAGLSVGK